MGLPVARADTRRVWAEALALVVAKCVLSYLVLRAGFTHVSDDDYSRTVIAEEFAHAPKLDPSGTSWLPFPFWIHGTAMLLFGRSLATARATAFVLGVVSTLIFFLALRLREPRQPAVVAFAAFALPWMAWLSVAMVPEAICAGLASAGILGLSRSCRFERVDLLCAVSVLCAALCRYEAWAVGAFAAIIIVVRARRQKQLREGAALVAVCVLAPLLWIAWNKLTRGDALNFLARVAKFRKNSGQGDTSLVDQLLFYPAAVWREQKEVLVLALLSIAGIARSRQVRATYGGALLACVGVLVFLVVGAWRGGAPTHHAARALCITYPILVAAALASLRALAEQRVSARAASFIASGATALLIALPWFAAEPPGRSAAEDREREVAKGVELREQRATHLTVTPCTYEHFALTAAYGQPENVTVLPAQKPADASACTPSVMVVW